MKNAFLAILFCAFSIAYAFTQQAFAPVGTQWTYTEYAFFPPIPNSPWNWKSRPWRLECVAEAAFQGRQCRKLVGGVLGLSPETEFYVYSQGDSVFLWNGQQFTLLYDFNAKPGDKWFFEHPEYTFGMPVEITVDSLGLTQVGQTTVKTWYIHYDDFFDWGNVIYEGIGNACYFVPKSDLIDRPFCNLRCFANPIQTLDLNFGAVPCDFVDIISKTEEPTTPNTAALSLAPNPAQDETFLNLSGYKGIVSIAIFDGQGRMLKTEKHPVGAAGQTTIPLPLDDLPRGLLWVRCAQEGFAQTVRLAHLR